MVWNALLGLAKRSARWIRTSIAASRGNQAGFHGFPETPEPVQVSRRTVSSKVPPVAGLPQPEKGVRYQPVTLDEVCISLSELDMSMRRWFTSDLPHEVSVFVPHAEVRIRKSRGVQETELVLESITIVHTPRYPPERPGRAAEDSG